MELANIFDSENSKRNKMMKEYAKLQRDFTVQVLDTLPEKFTALQDARNVEYTLNETKNSLLNDFPEEFNKDGLTDDYINERRRRRIITFSAMMLEACATGYSLNLMFGVKLEKAVVIGALMAILAFFGASTERVASLNFKSKWMWIIFASYNILLAFAGVFLGLKENTDMSFVLLHVLISSFSFSIVLAALRHSEKIDRDKLISRVNRKLRKIVKLIKESGRKIQKCTEDMRTEMSKMKHMAIGIYGYYELSGRDNSNMKLTTIPSLIINQVFREDIIPVQNRPINLTQLPHSELMNRILGDFGNIQANENSITGSLIVDEVKEPPLVNGSIKMDSISSEVSTQNNNFNDVENREIDGLPESETEL